MKHLKHFSPAFRFRTVKPSSPAVKSETGPSFFSQNRKLAVVLIGFLSGVLAACFCKQSHASFFLLCCERLFFAEERSFASLLAAFLFSELPLLLLLYLLGFCPIPGVLPDLFLLLRSARSGLLAAFLTVCLQGQGRVLFFAVLWLPECIWLFLLSLRVKQIRKGPVLSDNEEHPGSVFRQQLLDGLFLLAVHGVLALLKAALTVWILPKGF